MQEIYIEITQHAARLNSKFKKFPGNVRSWILLYIILSIINAVLSPRGALVA